MDLETSTTDSWEAFGSTLKYQSFGKLWSNLPTTSVQSRTGTPQDPLGGHGEPLLIWKVHFQAPVLFIITRASYIPGTATPSLQPSIHCTR